MKRDRIARRNWLAGVLAFALFAAALLPAVTLGGTKSMATPELSPSGVPKGQVDILASYFKDAQLRLSAMVLQPTGRTEAAQAFRSGRAAVQLVQVDAVLQRLRHQTADWLGSDKTLLAAVHEGRRLADRQAVEAGVRGEKMLPGSFDVVDERTAAVFARDTYEDLDKAARSMGDRSKRLLRQTAQLKLGEDKINAILAGGVIEGTPVLTIRKLREELRAVHGETVEINGRNYDVAKYASLVARTKTREATVEARHGRLGDLGLDLVAVIGRVSNNFCSAFLGQVFSLSGKHPTYPAYASLPGGGAPFHPNCSKSTRPFVEALASPAQLRQAETLADAGSLLGQSPAEAQRRFQDLQLRPQIQDRYATTEKKLFAA
jgi:hypothetical protein